MDEHDEPRSKEKSWPLSGKKASSTKSPATPVKRVVAALLEVTIGPIEKQVTTNILINCLLTKK